MRDDDVKSAIMSGKKPPKGTDYNQYLRCVNTLTAQGVLHKESHNFKVFKKVITPEVQKDFELE